MDQLLVSGIIALGGVIAVLYKTISTNHLETKEALSDCLEDREVLHKKIGGLTVRIDELENLAAEKNG